jgi:hypothetical protein
MRPKRVEPTRRRNEPPASNLIRDELSITKPLHFVGYKSHTKMEWSMPDRDTMDFASCTASIMQSRIAELAAGAWTEIRTLWR